MGRELSLKRRTFKKSLSKRYKRVKKNTLKRKVSKKIKKNTLKRRVSKRKILRKKSFRGGTTLEQLKEEIRKLEGLQEKINRYNFPKVVPDDVQGKIKRTYNLRKMAPYYNQESWMNAVISRTAILREGQLVRHYNRETVDNMIKRINNIFNRVIDAIHFMLTICLYIDSKNRKRYDSQYGLKQYCYYDKKDFDALKRVIITDINRVLSEKRQAEIEATRLAAEKAKHARQKEYETEKRRQQQLLEEEQRRQQEEEQRRQQEKEQRRKQEEEQRRQQEKEQRRQQEEEQRRQQSLLDSLLKGKITGYMKVNDDSRVEKFELDKLYIPEIEQLKGERGDEFEELHRGDDLRINFVIKLTDGVNTYILCWEFTKEVSYYSGYYFQDCSKFSGYSQTATSLARSVFNVKYKSKEDCRYERIMKILNAIKDESFDRRKLEAIKSDAKTTLETFLKKSDGADYYVKPA